MATDFHDPKPNHHSLVRGGPSYRLARRLGFEPPTPTRRLLKILLLVLVTWVPLVLLSLLQGHALGHRVAVPLLPDPVIYSRFLVVVPLLELAQIVVETSLAVQMWHFLDSGLVPERERPRFESAQAEVIHLRGSVVAGGVIVVLSVTIPVVMRVVVRLETGDSSWERLGTTITPAGWWYILVSLPVLIFFLLYWVWVFLLWAWFLFRVSRLDLELTPTHPDRAGGLGFLGWGLASFAIVLMAVSVVLSASFAGEILHRGSSLARLKYHVIIFVVLALVILHAPLLVFTGRLARCRFRALLKFGTLVWCHDRAFDEKWVKPQVRNRESLLGSPDVSSLVDIAGAFEHVERMQLMPFDKKALIVLVLAALIPMIPLLGTVIPLTEILSTLGKFLV
jgi:hypothetical protein